MRGANPRDEHTIITTRPIASLLPAWRKFSGLPVGRPFKYTEGISPPNNGRSIRIGAGRVGNNWALNSSHEIVRLTALRCPLERGRACGISHGGVAARCRAVNLALTTHLLRKSSQVSAPSSPAIHMQP